VSRALELLHQYDFVVSTNTIADTKATTLRQKQLLAFI
jgi:hypothetical protein